MVLEPEGARRVYVSVAGTLLESTPAGAVVEKDQTLARLKNLDVEMEVEWPEGGRSLYVRDPAGNSVELAPPTLWGGGWRFGNGSRE